MANFNVAVGRLFAIEGYRSNHEDDPGGETYYGIAKAYWPDWYEQWGGPPTREQAEEFYNQVFWRAIRGHKIHDQNVAEELFEQAVNLGIKRAVTFAQACHNWAHRFKRIAVDGRMGPQTLGALNEMSKFHTRLWLKMMNGMQFSYYVYRADKMDELTGFFDTQPDPASEVFLRGWVAQRVGFDDDD